ACADLALASAYQLPPATVAYLHRLVGRAHNQLYRSASTDIRSWGDILFRQAPQRIFADPCVRAAALIFFGLFTIAMLLAANPDRFPGFADTILGAEQIGAMEDSFEEPLAASFSHYISMSGFYINHNAGIG